MLLAIIGYLWLVWLVAKLNGEFLYGYRDVKSKIMIYGISLFAWPYFLAQVAVNKFWYSGILALIFWLLYLNYLASFLAITLWILIVITFVWFFVLCLLFHLDNQRNIFLRLIKKSKKEGTMNTNGLLEKIKEVIEKNSMIFWRRRDYSPELVTPEAKLINDLGFDSLGLVEFGFCLEERLGVEISDDQVQSRRTIGDVIKTLALFYF